MNKIHTSQWIFSIICLIECWLFLVLEPIIGIALMIATFVGFRYFLFPQERQAIRYGIGIVLLCGLIIINLSFLGFYLTSPTIWGFNPKYTVHVYCFVNTLIVILGCIRILIWGYPQIKNVFQTLEKNKASI